MDRKTTQKKEKAKQKINLVYMTFFGVIPPCATTAVFS